LCKLTFKGKGSFIFTYELTTFIWIFFNKHEKVLLLFHFLKNVKILMPKNLKCSHNLIYDNDSINILNLVLEKKFACLHI